MGASEKEERMAIDAIFRRRRRRYKSVLCLRFPFFFVSSFRTGSRRECILLNSSADAETLNGEYQA